MRVAILSPIYNSLYARQVTHLAALEPGLEVVQINFLNIFNLKRIQGEMRRDGSRLLTKVQAKLIQDNRAHRSITAHTLSDLANEVGLPGKTLSDLAKLHRVPIIQINDHNEHKALAALRETQPDVIAFTGGGLIRKELLGIPKFGVMNCHAGLLPPYRGMDVVEWPILEANGQPAQTGITIHFMDPGVDTGPILQTQPIPVEAGETVATFRARIEPYQVRLMLEGLRGLRDGTIHPQPQAKEGGKQYFVMHPRIKAVVEDKIAQS